MLHIYEFFLMVYLISPLTRIFIVPFSVNLQGFRSLDQEDPLAKGMTTDSSILVWNSMDGILAGYSPWGHKESDTTELLTFSLYSFNEKFFHAFEKHVLRANMYQAQRGMQKNNSPHSKNGDR